MTELLHWNVRGLKDKLNSNYKKKVQFIKMNLEQNHKTLIFNLQETHLTNEDEVYIWKTKWSSKR